MGINTAKNLTIVLGNNTYFVLYFLRTIPTTTNITLHCYLLYGLTLSRLGARLVRILVSSVHKSVYSGRINLIPSSAKWVCYVLPIHVACSIMQIGPLVPKIQQVTGLRGR